MSGKMCFAVDQGAPGVCNAGDSSRLARARVLEATRCASCTHLQVNVGLSCRQLTRLCECACLDDRPLDQPGIGRHWAGGSSCRSKSFCASAFGVTKAPSAHQIRCSRHLSSEVSRVKRPEAGPSPAHQDAANDQAPYVNCDQIRALMSVPLVCPNREDDARRFSVSRRLLSFDVICQAQWQAHPVIVGQDLRRFSS